MTHIFSNQLRKPVLGHDPPIALLNTYSKNIYS